MDETERAGPGASGHLLVAAESRIVVLNRLLRTLAEVNGLIARAAGPGALLAGTCRVAVEAGGFLMAWVGQRSPDGSRVVPVASAGAVGGYLDDIDVRLDESPQAHGPAATAFREGCTVTVDDIASDPCMAPSRDAALRRGFRSMVSCPVPTRVGPAAVFSLYSEALATFEGEALATVEEVAQHLGFALDVLEERRQRELERRHEEERVRFQAHILDVVGRAVLATDREGRVTFWNRAAEALFGLGAEDVVGRPVSEALPSASGLHAEERLQRGDAWSGELSVRRRDGTVVPVGVTTTPDVDGNGRLNGAVAVIADLSAQKRAGAQLRLWARVMEQSAEAILVTDADATILTVNDAFERVTGFTRAEVVGKKPSVLKSGRHDAAFYEEMWAALQGGGSWQGEIWNRRKGGEVYPQWLSISAVRDERARVTHYVGVARDESEKREFTERIQRLAQIDALTGLPNRMLLRDRLAQAVATARRRGCCVGLLHLDVDRFKEFNDAVGLEVADRLLVELAARLRTILHENDTVARLGGDEFAVVLTELREAADGALVGEKVGAAMREPFLVDGREFRLTLSMGISVWPDDAPDVPALLRNADAAMHHAKGLGRGTYQYFTPDLNTRAFEALALETALKRALERDELLLHFQPQVSLGTGEITGLEALVRWQHPELGLVPPSRFIPLAEERGLIVPLGAWVLRAACAQAAAFRRQGLPAVPMAVNISALQFRDRGFGATLRRALEESGLPAALLELELTESVLARETDAAIGMVRELRDSGLSLAIDDFGTGYSSLSYLQRLPISKLKVDQSFVRDLSPGSDSAVIVTAIMGIARSLRLKVLAEGVEQHRQLAFLRFHGCDEGQGFLFSRPLPAEELAPILAKGAIHPG